MRSGLVLSGLVTLALGAPPPEIGITVKDTSASNIVNIHVDVPETTPGRHVFTYGRCDNSVRTEYHSTIANISQMPTGDDIRLVWVVPETARSGGCISGWGPHNELLGRSKSVNLKNLIQSSINKRDRVPMTNGSGIDSDGPWFNGVNRLQNEEISAVDVKKAKSKSIGILGAGISGLMAYHLLQSVGFTNVEISESTDRIGGRIRTEYFELPDSKYQYQEMGAMRIPLTTKISSKNESLNLNFTNHHIVFQLAETLNSFNHEKGEDEFNIDFIPFIENSENSLSLSGNTRNPDGSIPTVGEVSSNSSLAKSTINTPEMDKLRAKLIEIFFNPRMTELIGSNIYEAHKLFLESGLDGKGGDDWSRIGYFHDALGFDLNTTDLPSEFTGVDGPLWKDMYENLFFRAKEWRTIDRGMSRLPNAFKPMLQDNIKYYRKIQKVEHLENENQVKVSWKGNYKDRQFQSATYDHAIIAVPFTVIRKWELPDFSITLNHAIANLGYSAACKVALQFKSRFWEHLNKPILGGCNTQTDVPGIGSVCYPSYNLNSTGPAVVLASFNQDDYGNRWVSTPEEEHIQYVLDAFAKLHGDIVYDQYTGDHRRLCWLEEESNAGGSWATPGLGQHKLYIPSYFNTEKQIIFIGEHTSYTHSWIASALESAVRGTVQLLLELGLVDEAKEITRTWMGQWIKE